MIPKIIHYCWFGGNPYPKTVKRCIASWKKYCPDYEIKLWNESNYDVSKNAWLEQAYRAKKWAFVSDYARLDIIYHEGGIYLDTDVELLKSLDPLLEKKCYIGRENSSGQCNTGLGFGAEKYNPVLEKVLETYHHVAFSETNMADLACPKLNDPVIRSYGTISDTEITELPGITVYPPRYFDPYGNKNLLCDETYSIHHYTSLWTGRNYKLKRKIAICIGQDNVIRIKSCFRKIQACIRGEK